MCFLAHAFHEEYQCYSHSYFDSYYQVKSNCKYKSRDQYYDVALGSCLAEMHKGSPLAHIIGNHKKDRCYCGHGDK